jgi:hypothetical protein
MLYLLIGRVPKIFQIVQNAVNQKTEIATSFSIVAHSLHYLNLMNQFFPLNMQANEHCRDPESLSCWELAYDIVSLVYPSIFSLPEPNINVLHV